MVYRKERPDGDWSHQAGGGAIAQCAITERRVDDVSYVSPVDAIDISETLIASPQLHLGGGK